MQTKTQRFGTLDVGRWLAAVAVVLFHCSMFLQHKPFGGDLKAGYHGVDFFFVLSGFVIANAHLKDVGHRERILPYLEKRFLRIYPPYWVALLLSIAWAYGHPFWQPINTITVVTNFLLIPKRSVDYPFVIPAWTLHYELLFYALFALMILLPRYMAYVALLAWPIGIYFFGIPLTAGTFPASFLMSKVILEFFFGIGACLLYKRVGWGTGLVLFTAGVVSLGVAVVLETAPTLLPAWASVLPPESRYGISSAAIIGGMAAVEARLWPLRSRVTDALGNMTYSTYLVHYTLLIVIIATGTLARFDSQEPWLTCLILAASCLLAGWAFFEVLERPAVRLSKYLLDAAKRPNSGQTVQAVSEGIH